MADKEYQRLAVYFDAAMLEDEKIVLAELARQGIKGNRSSAVRYALHQLATELQKRDEKPKK